MDDDVSHAVEARLNAIEDQLGLAHDGSGPITPENGDDDLTPEEEVDAEEEAD